MKIVYDFKRGNRTIDEFMPSSRIYNYNIKIANMHIISLVIVVYIRSIVVLLDVLVK